MFYTATFSSVLTFGMSCWGGNASKQDKNRLDKNTKKAGDVVGRRQESINTVYHRLVTNKLRTILADETHPLRPEFDNRHTRTDRSDRFRIPRSRTTRYLQSFIPTAIRTHNQQAGRSTQHASAGDGGAGTTKGGGEGGKNGGKFKSECEACCTSGL